MSDTYRALTRTYRPTSFDDIVSQEHVSSTLKNAIKKNRLAHAYMFCGPRGVGKTTMARVLARTVNEIDREMDGEALNQTLNIIEIDAASNNKVDDIRDLRERVRIPPQNGRYKIYIIDEVHMLSKSAFNALLKTLEEPPDHVIFIFATTEPHKVLPTILSRVQRFDFKRISIEEIVKRLANVARDEGIHIDEESLHVIAKKADGALRDALGLMDQAIAFCGTDIAHEELLKALNVVSTDRMFEFMKAVEQHDASTGLELINSLLQEGYDIQEYLVGLTEHLRNLYVATSSAKMHLVEASPHLKQRYKGAATAFSEDDLMRMLHTVSEAQFKIKDAQQPKIQLEITLLKLINMERSRELNSLLQELRDLKKNFSNSDISSDPAADSTPAMEKKTADSEGPSGSDATAEEASPAPQTQDPRPSYHAKNNTAPENGEPPKNHTAAENHAVSENDAPDNGTPAEKNATPGDRTASENASTTVSDPILKENPPTDSKPAEPTSGARETSAESSASPEGDDPLTSLFGEASLSNAPSGNGTVEPPSNGSAQSSPNGSASVKEAQEEEPEPPARAPKDVSLKEVQDLWEEFTLKLRKQVPEMLYFQMQRVDPIKLEKGNLLLRCNDDFAKQIVDENKRQLAKILQQELGAFLNFTSTVYKQESDQEESMSPYERFKQLQERDPTIKTLIELFGAELDYNLNP